MKEMGEVFFSLLTLNNLLYMNIGLLGGIVVGAASRINGNNGGRFACSNDIWTGRYDQEF